MTRPLVLVLAIWLASPAGAQPALLQIRVVEGEGAVYAIGSRATRGVSVQITDETGRPVDGATISFRLPDEGPGGTFASRAKTEIATTRADGRASVWGMEWNRIPGQLQIRITAVKGQARAGTVCGIYLSDSVSARATGPAPPRFGRKWIMISMIAAGVAGAGIAAGAVRGASPSTPEPAALRIGAPSINLGRP